MLGREVSSLAFCSADGEAASGCTEGKRVELPDCSTAVIVGDGESASRVTGLGVRPRPMDLQRLLHLVRDGGCLLLLVLQYGLEKESRFSCSRDITCRFRK